MTMRAALAALPMILFAAPALAQHGGHGAHTPAPATQPAPTPEPEPEPELMWPTQAPVGDAPAPEPPARYAADDLYDPAVMAAARAQLRREHGGGTVSKFMADTLEYRAGDDEDGYAWEAEAWFGGDRHRIVFKTEGEGADGALEAAEAQVLYARAISPYFNLEFGLRTDIEPAPERAYAVLALDGLAPYWFDVGGALFLSDRGELSARFEGAYDLRLTQRLILQPSAELNLSADDIPARHVSAGVTSTEVALRLRYEITRQVAPYIGIVSERLYGAGADHAHARANAEPEAQESFVIGLRAWF